MVIDRPAKRVPPVWADPSGDPLMLIFEDLHGIDEETQGLLNLLAEGMPSAPALLLVNYRPEYTHQWNSKTYYTQLRLDPLGDESGRRC